MKEAEGSSGSCAADLAGINNEETEAPAPGEREETKAPNTDEEWLRPA